MKRYAISRKGKDEKAASRLPRNSCHVPKETMERTKNIMRYAASLFMDAIVTTAEGSV